MPAYETVFAVPASLPEEERSASLELVKELIEKSGGNVNSIDEMGEKRMGYPVKKHEVATYYSVLFECPPEAIESLKRNYRQEERYIRHIVIKKESK